MLMHNHDEERGERPERLGLVVCAVADRESAL
jgi:hypothetical protein